MARIYADKDGYEIVSENHYFGVCFKPHCDEPEEE